MNSKTIVRPNRKFIFTRLNCVFYFKFVQLLGKGCSRGVEHTPAEQNSWVYGFNSCQVLGFFLLFLSLSSASLISSLKKVQHCWLSFTKIDALLCSLGQNKHNMHRFSKKSLMDTYHWKYPKSNSTLMHLLGTVYCQHIHQSQIWRWVLICTLW